MFFYEKSYKKNFSSCVWLLTTTHKSRIFAPEITKRRNAYEAITIINNVRDGDL